MTERRRVFRLFACCVAVRGARRSTVCDLQRRTYDLIPNGLHDLLTVHADSTLDEIRALFPPETHARIDEYFGFLERKEYGFWCDDPDAFPPLDPEWDRPQRITNAIIDVDAGSRHDFADLLRQLDDLGCAAVQVRWFAPVSLEELETVLKQTYSRRLRSVELLLPWNAGWEPGALHALCLRHVRVSGVVVHSAPEASAEVVDGARIPLFHRTEVIDSHAHCGQVSPEWFSVSMAGFLEARSFNSCLNRKISVDAAGEIRNCPSLPRSFGNAADTSLVSALMQAEFRELWEINKDQVEVCRDCEFRYVCTDCRAFVATPGDRLSKPSKCSYDPYAARWA
ncbi:MAG TPA: grasp-with-spasm system SPASM domain peptide maturase [Longimicrobiaceae bacterium]|jgi:SPASM domain peptide maturase of grasp-with-spasm system|nr:grasp-with-spasm system SPASM domain peptide maturase [Longimicrobiaceae bacterium]